MRQTNRKERRFLPMPKGRGFHGEHLMRIIEPSFAIITPINGEEILKAIERIGRVCYKSEDKIQDGTAHKFVRMLINRGHEAMIEHYTFSVQFICDRGVSHEIVRHRIASFAQESTRYCNYSNEKFSNGVTFIKPFFWDNESKQYQEWLSAMEYAERQYIELVRLGASPQEARSVLPNSTKTEIVVTMNLREWRHFFKLRADYAAHPQMKEIVRPLLNECKKLIPVVFDDISFCMDF